MFRTTNHEQYIFASHHFKNKNGFIESQCFQQQTCRCTRDSRRVARWFDFKPKIPIWVNFGGLAMENASIFYGYLEYFTVIWYIYGHLVML
jgi:hypothetical protein